MNPGIYSSEEEQEVKDVNWNSGDYKLIIITPRSVATTLMKKNLNGIGIRYNHNNNNTRNPFVTVGLLRLDLARY